LCEAGQAGLWRELRPAISERQVILGCFSKSMPSQNQGLDRQEQGLYAQNHCVDHANGVDGMEP